MSFRLNPLLDGLNDLLVKFSLFSEVPGGNSSVRRESPRMELFGKEPCAGVKFLRLLDNCCSTLTSRAGSLLKWVVAYRSVKETGWEMNLPYNSHASLPPLPRLGSKGHNHLSLVYTLNSLDPFSLPPPDKTLHLVKSNCLHTPSLHQSSGKWLENNKHLFSPASL